MKPRKRPAKKKDEDSEKEPVAVGAQKTAADDPGDEPAPEPEPSGEES